jgi:hypothetical protein
MQESRSTREARLLGERDAVIVSRTVAGKTVADIASELGISTDTVYRRMRLPHVKAALADARAAEVRPLVDAAVGNIRSSVERLAAVRDDDTARPGDRIRACVALLDWALDLWQIAEVLPRLAAVEAALGVNGANTDCPPTTLTPPPVGPGIVADDIDEDTWAADGDLCRPLDPSIVAGLPSPGAR